jgi:hypothetical protein
MTCKEPNQYQFNLVLTTADLQFKSIACLFRRSEKYSFASLTARMQRPLMSVVLNPFALKAFVISESSHLTIGIVRWGMEFGLLTISPNGEYVRVNGSTKERLNSDDVRAAIFRAVNL